MNSDQKWRYIEPAGPTAPDPLAPVEVTLTEQQIIDQYYPYWCKRMVEIGKADQVTLENCIEDWVVVHWAYKVEG